AGAGFGLGALAASPATLELVVGHRLALARALAAVDVALADVDDGLADVLGPRGLAVGRRQRDRVGEAVDALFVLRVEAPRERPGQIDREPARGLVAHALAYQRVGSLAQRGDVFGARHVHQAARREQGVGRLAVGHDCAQAIYLGPRDRGDRTGRRAEVVHRRARG